MLYAAVKTTLTLSVKHKKITVRANHKVTYFSIDATFKSKQFIIGTISSYTVYIVFK